MTGSRKQQEVGTDLLVRVEHVKYRQSGPGKSPIGSLSAYQDRVEWCQNGHNEPQLVIPYSNIKIQRISQPNKDKVQLQICMNSDDQATFVFMKPGSPKDQIIADRDLIKETIQTSLLRYRQINQANTVKAFKSQNDALEAKKKLLLNDQELQKLYRHLVSTKLITPNDFWDLHPIPHTSKDELGIPSGFLSSISQTEEGNGIRMNLTVDTIHAIFKTYPVVEKKHLELVPHAMSEQEFWAKFFQSHYFHRERDMNEDPNDPFYDCDKHDILEINEQKRNGIRNRGLDFGYLLDDLGVISDINVDSSNGQRVGEDEEVDRLVRRCNYHSGRLLSAIIGDLNTVDHAERRPSAHTAYNLQLESEELAEMDTDNQLNPLSVNVRPSQFSLGPKCHPPEDAKRWKAAVLRFVDEPACTPEFERAFFDDILCGNGLREKGQLREDFQSGLKKNTIQELCTLYSVTWELLRHFWSCMPPTSPAMEAKLDKVNETLIKFEDVFLKYSQEKIGEKHVGRLFMMVDKARTKYETYLQVRQSKKIVPRK